MAGRSQTPLGSPKRRATNDGTPVALLDMIQRGRNPRRARNVPIESKMMNPQSPRLSPCVVAEFSDAGNLANALNALEQSHFEPQNVSIITHAHDSGFAGLGDSAATDVEKASDDKSMASEKTMGASTLAGGAIGAALGTATLIGPLLVVGPIVGMAAGAVAGGLLSAVEGWNIDRQTAESYQAKVEAGSSLIIVTDDPPRLTEASQILATCNPATLQRFE